MYSNPHNPYIPNYEQRRELNDLNRQFVGEHDLLELHREICRERGLNPDTYPPNFHYLAQISAERAAKKQQRSAKRYTMEDPLSQNSVGRVNLLQALRRQMSEYKPEFIKQVVSYIFGYIVWQLVSGRQSVRTPLGTFRRVYRGPRRVFNPHTNMYHDVPGYYTVKFKASAETRRIVNPDKYPGDDVPDYHTW
jgi:nucleoid DNA-binding protein